MMFLCSGRMNQNIRKQLAAAAEARAARNRPFNIPPAPAPMSTPPVTISSPSLPNVSGPEQAVVNPPTSIQVNLNISKSYSPPFDFVLLFFTALCDPCLCFCFSLAILNEGQLSNLIAQAVKEALQAAWPAANANSVLQHSSTSTLSSSNPDQPASSSTTEPLTSCHPTAPSGQPNGSSSTNQPLASSHPGPSTIQPAASLSVSPLASTSSRPSRAEAPWWARPRVLSGIKSDAIHV